MECAVRRRANAGAWPHAKRTRVYFAINLMLPRISSRSSSQRLALLEALEELFEDADHNRVDADAFGFGPFFELEPGFCADVEELRVGKLHAGLAGLHDVYFFALNMAQSKKDDPGQIALYARLFGDCFAQINGEAQRHSRTVVRPPLPLAVHFPQLLFFAAFLTAMDSPPRTLPGTVLLPRVQSDFS